MRIRYDKSELKLAGFAEVTTYARERGGGQGRRGEKTQMGR